MSGIDIVGFILFWLIIFVSISSVGICYWIYKVRNELRNIDSTLNLILDTMNFKYRSLR